jgi:hypothetical protein
MATVNYSWNLPTVGGSEDTWGTSLNANWTDLDTLLGGVSQTEFAILDGATVSTAELNILDGVTATTAEVNILDGVTATTAEVNQLDGNIFTADVVPNADSTLDLGSSSAAWALAYLDAIEPVGADTTIKRVGGTSTTPIVEGLAKAWVRYDQVSVNIQSSFNISSVTDASTGNWDVNLTTSMSNGDYTMASSIQIGSGGGRITGTDGTTASGVSMVTRRANDATVLDSDDCCVALLGDLA